MTKTKHLLAPERVDAVLEEIFTERCVALLGEAVKRAGNASHLRAYRWAHVRDLFGFGSTSAYKLCERFGVDPDEYAGGGWTCDVCGQELEAPGAGCDNDDCHSDEED